MGARSRLEKQPTDFRQNICYFGDRTLDGGIADVLTGIAFNSAIDKLRPREPLSGKAMATEGALEALNGMLLFGLTTAFLFAMIQKVWPLGSRGWHRNAQLR